MDFPTINWLAVLVATVAAFMLGGLWYGPLFGKQWQRRNHLSDQQIASANMAMIFGPAFVMILVQAVLFAILLVPLAPVTLLRGLCLGIVIGLGFASTSLAVNYLFARKSIQLYAIDMGYITLQFTVLGGVLGAMA